MNTLIIDTHLYDINLYLYKNDDLLAEKHIKGEKHNSKFLLPSISDLCKDKDYNQIIVVNGPGSFTGVRLGVTVAKTLAFTQNIPIKSITSLDTMCYCGSAGHQIYAISDGNGYFIGEYFDYKLTKDYYYLSNAEYNNFSQKIDVVTNVAIDWVKVLKVIQNIDYSNPHSINPIYVKLIGVEYDQKNSK